MVNQNRRRFLQQSGIGLATAGVAGFVLHADALPTPALGASEDSTERVLIQMGPAQIAQAAKGELKQTATMPYGPAYKKGAPFRAKLCPPFATGTTLVMTGRVWAFDTKRPLPGVVLDLWHVDHQGAYSAGDGDFKNRGRLVTTESGAYEFESIRPVAYQTSPNSNYWRCAHVHLLAVCPGYKPLVTEIHFQDDPKRKSDSMFNTELAVAVEKRAINGRAFEAAVFDIVLERDPSAR